MARESYPQVSLAENGLSNGVIAGRDDPGSIRVIERCSHCGIRGEASVIRGAMITAGRRDEIHMQGERRWMGGGGGAGEI